MFTLDYTINSGLENMQIDNNLLKRAQKENIDFILRFYGWNKPTITIGRNQKNTGIDEEFCKQNNISIVRRITGGKAVLHDKELTYCVIIKQDLLKNGNSVESSYKEICQPLIEGFKELGLNLNFGEEKKLSPTKGYCMALSTGADLSINGKKLIGSAQYRQNSYILQHGSILLDLDREKIRKIFQNDNADSSTITLKELGIEIDAKELSTIILNSFQHLTNRQILA